VKVKKGKVTAYRGSQIVSKKRIKERFKTVNTVLHEINQMVKKGAKDKGFKVDRSRSNFFFLDGATAIVWAEAIGHHRAKKSYLLKAKIPINKKNVYVGDFNWITQAQKLFNLGNIKHGEKAVESYINSLKPLNKLTKFDLKRMREPEVVYPGTPKKKEIKWADEQGSTIFERGKKNFWRYPIWWIKGWLKLKK